MPYTIDGRTYADVIPHLREIAALADPPLLVTIFVRTKADDIGRTVTNDEGVADQLVTSGTPDFTVIRVADQPEEYRAARKRVTG